MAALWQKTCRLTAELLGGQSGLTAAIHSGNFCGHGSQQYSQAAPDFDDGSDGIDAPSLTRFMYKE